MKSKKNIIFIIIIIIVLVLIILEFSLQRYENNAKNNNNIPKTKEVKKKNDSLIKNKKYKDLDITNINPYNDGNLNHITMTITNNSKEDFKSESANFIFLNDKNKKIYESSTLIPDIATGKEISIDLIVDTEALNAYTFTVESLK